MSESVLKAHGLSDKTIADAKVMGLFGNGKFIDLLVKAAGSPLAKQLIAELLALLAGQSSTTPPAA